MKLYLNYDQYLETEKLSLGIFYLLMACMGNMQHKRWWVRLRNNWISKS